MTYCYVRMQLLRAAKGLSSSSAPIKMPLQEAATTLQPYKGQSRADFPKCAAQSARSERHQPVPWDAYLERQKMETVKLHTQGCDALSCRG